MGPLVLTVLNRDYSAPYDNPNEGLVVSGGKHPKTWVLAAKRAGPGGGAARSADVSRTPRKGKGATLNPKP